MAFTPILGNSPVISKPLVSPQVPNPPSGSLDPIYENGVVVGYRMADDPATLVERVAAGTKQWSSADPDAWARVGSFFKGKYEFGGTGEFQSRVNKFAQDFTERYGTLPTERNILNSPIMDGYLQNLKRGYPTSLPPRFRFNGEIWENDPYAGPRLARYNLIDSELGDKAFMRYLNNTPTITQEQMNAIQNPRPPSSGRPRGPSGGGGRAPRVFDRAELVEGVTNRWRNKLFEDPDEAAVNTIVDSYASKGNAFWMSKGGDLDFETFVANELRKRSRYKVLYARKDPHLTDEEWMGRYRDVVEAFGFNEQTNRRETEAGLTSGVGLAGFTERVGRTREARTINQGAYSQRFAAGMAQSGLGRT